MAQHQADLLTFQQQHGHFLRETSQELSQPYCDVPGAPSLSVPVAASSGEEGGGGGGGVMLAAGSDPIGDSTTEAIEAAAAAAANALAHSTAGRATRSLSCLPSSQAGNKTATAFSTVVHTTGPCPATTASTAVPIEDMRQDDTRGAEPMDLSRTGAGGSGAQAFEIWEEDVIHIDSSQHPQGLPSRSKAQAGPLKQLRGQAQSTGALATASKRSQKVVDGEASSGASDLQALQQGEQHCQLGGAGEALVAIATGEVEPSVAVVTNSVASNTQGSFYSQEDQSQEKEQQPNKIKNKNKKHQKPERQLKKSLQKRSRMRSVLQNVSTMQPNSQPSKRL